MKTSKLIKGLKQALLWHDKDLEIVVNTVDPDTGKHDKVRSNGYDIWESEDRKTISLIIR